MGVVGSGPESIGGCGGVDDPLGQMRSVIFADQTLCPGDTPKGEIREVHLCDQR